MTFFTEQIEAARAIISTGAAAWKLGMLPGLSGNLSVRLSTGQILLTCSGTAKGRLNENDLAVVTQAGEIAANGCAQPSSESDLHLQIYARFQDARAILHTHPPYLQSLALKLGNQDKDFLHLDLFEAHIWRKRMVWVEPAAPGSRQVGQKCVKSVEAVFGNTPSLPCGAWLAKHGLCAIGANLSSCLAFSEELEHLAKVQLLAL